MFEAYLERMLIRGLKVAYISYFTLDAAGSKGNSKYDVYHRAEHNLANITGRRGDITWLVPIKLTMCRSCAEKSRFYME